MGYIVFFSLLLLITLLRSYLAIEKNRRIADKIKKQQYNERIDQVKSRLKRKLIILQSNISIKANHLASFNSIVGNFYVVQPHTDEKLEQLEDIVELLISTLNHSIRVLEHTENKQILCDKVEQFVEQLPNQGRLFNHCFYTTVLPTLIKSLEISTAPLEPIYEPEMTANRQETQQEAPLEPA
ncbi:hypothetical protein J8L70_08275 [Pseudoalteromonas sp. MMG010]|uniref:hypothetical protein n=1 Tax=Pseudoalteromonas sp. MMG010 TaxID=2822685 RepID=UPI001B39D33E|nr:hypothetical protein [Pseudoalteromonas sp. MMG010]MBQ4833234.1 hypothetical protein [Pseudoalteromonas sp. MMG010]